MHQLLSTTRPVVGAVCSLVGLSASIGGLFLKRWFECSTSVTTHTYGLQRVERSAFGYSLSENVCSSDVRPIIGAVPCDAGRIALGLGIVAAAMVGIALLLAAFIIFTRRVGNVWLATLFFNLLGGMCAIAAGASYIATMAKQFDGDEGCKAGQLAPIIMVAGGAVSVISSGLYCTCICRPPTTLARVVQIPLQEWDPEAIEQTAPTNVRVNARTPN